MLGFAKEIISKTYPVNYVVNTFTTWIILGLYNINKKIQ